MCEDIGPGDFVERVAPLRMGAELWPPEMRRGGVYRVEAVQAAGPPPRPNLNAECTFCGAGVGEQEPHWLVLSGVQGGWCLTAFRKVYRPRDQLFRDLLAPLPGIEIREMVDV